MIVIFAFPTSAAIGGIAHHPLNSLLDTGGVSPSRFVSGLTKGLVGVVAKPLGGAAEFVAQTGQGLLLGTGWASIQRQLHPSLPDHVCTFINSKAKYDWKYLTGTYDGQRILLAIDASQESHESKTYGLAGSCTILLTEELVIVVSADEDARSDMFSICDIECLGCPEDPTKLKIKLMDEIGKCLLVLETVGSHFRERSLIHFVFVRSNSRQGRQGTHRPVRHGIRSALRGFGRRVGRRTAGSVGRSAACRPCRQVGRRMSSQRCHVRPRSRCQRVCLLCQSSYE